MKNMQHKTCRTAYFNIVTNAQHGTCLLFDRKGQGMDQHLSAIHYRTSESNKYRGVKNTIHLLQRLQKQVTKDLAVFFTAFAIPLR